MYLKNDNISTKVLDIKQYLPISVSKFQVNLLTLLRASL